MDRLQPVVVDGRFVNPAFLEPGPDAPREMGYRDFRRWRKERKAKPRSKAAPRVPVHAREGPMPPAPERGVRATWVGHSSVVLQLDGLTYLCDPVWSRRAGGVVKRHTPPGVAWEDLPPVDALLLSHDHYDHLDAATVKRLPRDVRVVCPTGVGRWLRRRGFTRVADLSWWETAAVGAHRVTCVPAQHFSGRTLWDRNRTLWGGFVVEGPHAKAYFAGDTGWFAGFRQIGEAFPGLDLAMIPIGAYEPRWFMSSVHVDPQQAGQAFLDVGARVMLPIHWGTFRLADEPVDAPPGELLAWWDAKGLPRERVRVPALGE
ncbi:MAG TPA: MBL fold metallo-hydrolase, partial [Candidatus Thermoplasmatota archaeon]|nr:MBL fold metallo-hydrolase [Candidatus Thermoplasmatota archaeon]